MKIPRDLLSGDIAICNNGERRMVHGYYRDGELRTAVGNNDTCIAWGVDGRNYSHPDDHWIVRIERITSAKKPAKAKVDRDAAWLLRVPVAMCGHGSPGVARRLRAIARRLQGGKP